MKKSIAQLRAKPMMAARILSIGVAVAVAGSIVRPSSALATIVFNSARFDVATQSAAKLGLAEKTSSNIARPSTESPQALTADGSSDPITFRNGGASASAVEVGTADFSNLSAVGISFQGATNVSSPDTASASSTVYFSYNFTIDRSYSFSLDYKLVDPGSVGSPFYSVEFENAAGGAGSVISYGFGLNTAGSRAGILVPGTYALIIEAGSPIDAVKANDPVYPTSASNDDTFMFRFTAAVPEPSTWAMLVIGFAGLGFMARRRRTSVGFV